MGNKIDRLEAALERIEEARELVATGRSHLERARRVSEWSDYGAIGLRYAINMADSSVLRFGRQQKEVAAELERERERVAAEETRDAKREQARAKRVERRRERVERNIRVAWGEVRLGPDDWAVLWPSIVREAIMIDRAYCPEAWK